MYFKASANTQESRYKSRTVSIVVVVFGFIFTAHAIVTEATVPYYPCFLRIWLGYNTLTVFCFSILIRAIVYISQIDNKITIDDSESNVEDSDPKTFMDKSTLVRYKRLIFNSKYSRNIDDKQAEIQFRMTVNNYVLDLVRTRNYLIGCGVILALSISLSIYFTTFENYHINPSSYECPAGITTPILPLYIMMFVTLVLLVPLVFLTIGFTDAYGMQVELIITMVTTIILLTGLVVYNQVASPKMLLYATGYVIALPVFILQQVFLIIYPLFNIMSLNKQTGGRLRSGNSRNAAAATTRKEQFEGLLAYPAGFSRLSKAALETFCPENVGFLKDYQLLKYNVCSLVASINNEENKILSAMSRESDRMTKNISQTSLIENTEHGAKIVPGNNSLVLGIDVEDEKLEIPQEIDMDQLISGELVPPLPITIPEAVYKMGLIEDLQSLGDSQSNVEKTTPKMTVVPKNIKDDFWKFYQKYIQEDALLAVNISVKITAPISQAVQEDRFTLGIFDDALEEVLNSLYTNTYPFMLKTL
ncbi:hypothetical protein AYI70_g836 [Smittium culicis]|uniref:RGS domain-containing protein n=1 Tax=Smittium culicis TaxID=133412 RepID=A0A1R1YF40_9FUNG|nr:hypothetical protein AYI70_g836 [Smittium culicis]